MIDLDFLNSITADEILALPIDLQKLVLKLINYPKYNMLESIKPFPYQEQFMYASLDHEIRFLRAANRIGKTFGGALEMAYHVTGLYPDNWKGKKIEGSGRLFWCVSRDLKMVTDIMQFELLGTSNIRVTDDLGTKAIPKHCILADTKEGMKADGGRVESIRIKHKDGGTNTLEFFGSENPNSLMGRKVACAWMDEGHPNSVEIYSHLKTRIMNALGEHQNGLLYITATPEDSGTARLSEMFEKNKKAFYLQSATWWDSPLFSAEQIEKELALLPEWQRDMRSKGLPVMGDFAVFQYDDNKISADVIQPLPHWEVMAGVDFGETTDPSVISICLRDPDNDKYYVYREYYLDGDIEERSPKNIARILRDSPFSAVPVIVHTSDGVLTQNPEANANQLKKFGVNVFPVPFRNPYETKFQRKYTETSNKSTSDIATGLAEMCLMFSEDRLKVSRTCVNWFNEKRMYYLKVNPVTQSVKYAGADHCIDASRYALMSLMCNRGCLWSDVGNDSISQFRSFDTIQFN